MAVLKECSICGQYADAFTDNTSKTVTLFEKDASFLIQISLSPPRPDVCNPCFELLLLKLGKKLKGEKDENE